MPKKKKVQTPDWILEGFDSKADYNKAKGIDDKKKTGAQGHIPKEGTRTGRNAPKDFNKKSLQGAKTFKIRECPKCGSDDVGVVLSGSDSEEATNTGKEWECRKCKWKGTDILKKELSEDEMMKYLDEKEEEVE